MKSKSMGAKPQEGEKVAVATWRLIRLCVVPTLGGPQFYLHRDASICDKL